MTLLANRAPGHRPQVKLRPCVDGGHRILHRHRLGQTRAGAIRVGFRGRQLGIGRSGQLGIGRSRGRRLRHRTEWRNDHSEHGVMIPRLGRTRPPDRAQTLCGQLLTQPVGSGWPRSPAALAARQPPMYPTAREQPDDHAACQEFHQLPTARSALYRCAGDHPDKATHTAMAAPAPREADAIGRPGKVPATPSHADDRSHQQSAAARTQVRRLAAQIASWYK